MRKFAKYNTYSIFLQYFFSEALGKYSCECALMRRTHRECGLVRDARSNRSHVRARARASARRAACGRLAGRRPPLGHGLVRRALAHRPARRGDRPGRALGPLLHPVRDAGYWFTGALWPRSCYNVRRISLFCTFESVTARS